MQIEIPDKIIEEMINANILQQSGSINSADARGNQVQRLEYHIAEIVSAILAKEMKRRRLIK